MYHIHTHNLPLWKNEVTSTRMESSMPMPAIAFWFLNRSFSVLVVGGGCATSSSSVCMGIQCVCVCDVQGKAFHRYENVLRQDAFSAQPTCTPFAPTVCWLDLPIPKYFSSSPGASIVVVSADVDAPAWPLVFLGGAFAGFDWVVFCSNIAGSASHSLGSSTSSTAGTVLASCFLPPV